MAVLALTLLLGVLTSCASPDTCLASMLLRLVGCLVGHC
jgi:hypothetical protein